MTDIKFKRGDSMSLARTFRVDGVDYDLTGQTVTSQVRVEKDVESTLIADLTVSTPTSATVTLSLTSAQTDVLEPGVYYYDIKRDDGAGDVQHSEPYKFIIEKKVTE